MQGKNSPQKDAYDVTSGLIKGVQQVEARAQRNDMKLFKETTMTYAISPIYAKYIGPTVTIAFNGNFRKFPINGMDFTLSKGHYNALRKYLRSVDRQIQMQQTNVKFMDSTVTGDFKTHL